jgi:CBS domain containing-hemolysin-like protein
VAVVEPRYVAAKHTGLFEKDDLIKLLDQQQAQTDSRLTSEELEIAKRALGFGDHKVADVLTPRKAIKTVLADDTIGPVLIDELHKSGQPYALVRASAKGEIVGTLRFDWLGLESRGHVSDIMDDHVYYLHENDSLAEALHAFFVTNQSVFLVINNFEEYLGLLSVETILGQLLGHVPGDDFDQYADSASVAARYSHDRPEAATDAVKTDDKVIE